MKTKLIAGGAGIFMIAMVAGALGGSDSPTPTDTTVTPYVAPPAVVQEVRVQPKTDTVSAPVVTKPKTTTTVADYPASAPTQTSSQPKESEANCHSSYSGCLNPNASDYDCAGGSGNGPYYTGKVQVIGPDVFDLDRDNDGWGCE